jgi:predicted enzyme related to lactoylglutathione lyase
VGGESFAALTHLFPMNFTSVRLITADFEPLVGFYEQLFGQSLTRLAPVFAELRTAGATLAIGHTSTLAPFGGEQVATAAANRSVILEFRVADVDATYQRLSDLLNGALVQMPTTMPWGNRSLLFRDPDGNLVNLFTPVTAAATEKFASQLAE